MPLPIKDIIKKANKFTLNTPLVIAINLKGKGVNAPKNTIKTPCVVKAILTSLKSLALIQGKISKNFSTSFPNRYPKNQPNNPPKTEATVHKIESLINLFGLLKTSNANKGSIGNGKIIDSRKDNNSKSFLATADLDLTIIVSKNFWLKNLILVFTFVYLY